MARISKYERNLSNDIGYRGPLSYRYLMILGWLCLSFKIMNIFLSFGEKMNLEQPDWMEILGNVARFMGDLALPLFLMANFAIILDNKRTYKHQLIKFGGLSLLVIALFIFIKEHYIDGLVIAIVRDEAMAKELVEWLLYMISITGVMVFNLFIDLFMCTLFMFFLNYVPEKHFQLPWEMVCRPISYIPS